MLKLHYMNDYFEFWADVESDRTAAELYDVIDQACGAWEIDFDGNDGESDFTPEEFVLIELEEAGCRILGYNSARI